MSKIKKLTKILIIFGLITMACKKNSAPQEPEIVSYPSIGIKDVPYIIEVTAQDPDGDLLAVVLDYGDGTYSSLSKYFPSGDTISFEHTWTSAGTYTLKARASDEDGAASSWSAGVTVQIVEGGSAPNVPMIISYPSQGYVDSVYTIRVSASDPDGDSVSVQVDFGDGSPLHWSNYQPSGSEITFYHSWSNPGSYSIRAKAKDVIGKQSDWSDPVTVEIILDTLPRAPELISPAEGVVISKDSAQMGIYFSWNPVTGATAYEIQIDNNSDFSSPMLVGAPSQPFYYAQITNYSGKLYWRVRTWKNQTASLYSNPRTFYIENPTLAPPVLSIPANREGFTASELQILGIEFSWSTVSGVTSYQIQVDDDSNFSSPITDTSIQSTSIRLRLSPTSDRYYWRVRSWINEVPGPFSDSRIFYKIDETLTVPTPLSPSNGQLFWNNEIVDFSWSYVSGGVMYQIQIIDSVRTFSNPLVDTIISSTSISFPLISSGRYQWRVRARRSDDVPGQYSSPLTFYLCPYLVKSFGIPYASYDVFVYNNYAYVANNWSPLYIINVSNPSNPYLAGQYDTPGSCSSVYVSGSYAFVADGLSLLILNVTNPSNPYEVGNVAIAAQKVYVYGYYAFVAAGQDGLVIVDVSNPSDPHIVASCVSPGGGGGVRDVYVEDSYAYVANGEAGLVIVDVSDPHNPQVLGSYDTPENARAVKYSNGFAYVADHGSGLRVIDVQDPYYPYEISYYSTPGAALGVAIDGNFAYIAYEWAGFRVVDISNPENLFEVGYYVPNQPALGVFKHGNYAYVANGSNGLLILRVKE